VTDETTPPAGEPEPGTTDWLLAQLSGGRIDSRRERREAEAALEAAGVAIPDAAAEPTTAEEPAADAAPAAPAADERPRARFSWDTGKLEAVDTAETDVAGTEAAAAAEVTPAADAAGPADAPAAEATPAREGAPEAERVIPFMWNLSPTHEPDPALNPPVDIPEPSFDEPDFPFPSAAPIVVPKPARSPITDAPTDAPASPVAPTAEPEQATTPEAEPAATPEPEDAAAPEAPAHAPLPPGTTAHEFDPFAQDLFAPVPATTPVPSVDEFTIPDETEPPQASAPASEETGDTGAEPRTSEVSSDWSDIADMLGAHPQTVDTAIVSPMPPVNEILPSFDALRPRSAAASETPEPANGPEAEPRGAAAPADVTPADATQLDETQITPTALAVPAAPTPAASPLPFAPDSARVFDQSPPPAHPGGAPVEHARSGSPLNRWLLIAAAVLIAILIGIGLFALGRAVASGRDQAPAAATHTSTPTPTATTASPTSTPTPTASDDTAIAGSGPLAPGQSYQWDQLRGGECLDPFASAWAQDFTVVDCNAPHAAQLVYTAPYTTDPSAAFPGEQAISAQIGLLCSKPGVVDLNAAAAYSDVQLVTAYPVTAEQWASGQRNYFCFVTRSSGQQFSSSIAGPGPTQ